MPTSSGERPVYWAHSSETAARHILPWHGPMEAVAYRFSVSIWSKPSSMAWAMSFSSTSSQKQTKRLPGADEFTTETQRHREGDEEVLGGDGERHRPGHRGR